MFLNDGRQSLAGGIAASFKGNERRYELLQRENPRPLRLLQILRFVVVVGALAAVVILMTGCAQQSPSPAPSSAAHPATRNIVKRVSVPVCPSDAQLRAAAIEASRATYQQAPGGQHNCACPIDTYVNRGVTHSCSGTGAVKPSSWAMCTAAQVPQTLVDQMKTKFSACK